MALSDKWQNFKSKASGTPAEDSGSDPRPPEDHLPDSPTLSGEEAAAPAPDFGKKVRDAVDRLNGSSEDSYSVWKRSSKRALMIGIALVIVIGYLFFFTSPLYIKDKEADNDPTPVGEPQYFGEDTDKSMTIDTWRYSPSQGLMEIKLDVTNEAYDGKDSYVFGTEFQSADETAASAVRIEPMVTDPDFIVLIVHNIPQEWVSMGLTVYYPGETKGEPLLELYASESSISKVDRLKPLSSNGYRAAVVDEQIAAIQKRVKALNRQIAANNQTISNMDKEAQRINGQMALDTEAEQAADQQSLANIQERQQELEAQNEDTQLQIAKLNSQIAQLTKKRDAYFGLTDDTDRTSAPAVTGKAKPTRIGDAAVKLQTTQPAQKAKAPKDSGTSGKSSPARSGTAKAKPAKAAG